MNAFLAVSHQRVAWVNKCLFVFVSFGECSVSRSKTQEREKCRTALSLTLNRITVRHMVQSTASICQTHRRRATRSYLIALFLTYHRKHQQKEKNKKYLYKLNCFSYKYKSKTSDSRIFINWVTGKTRFCSKNYYLKEFKFMWK